MLQQRSWQLEAATAGMDTGGAWAPYVGSFEKAETIWMLLVVHEIWMVNGWLMDGSWMANGWLMDVDGCL